MNLKSIILAAIYVFLISGTLLLFWAISNIAADEIVLPGFVFYSVFNFIIFSTPSLLSIFYAYKLKNDKIAISIYLLFVIYWFFDIYFKYKANDFRCTFWHQGELLCPAFDSVITQLVLFDFAIVLLAASSATFLKQYNKPPKNDHFRLAIFLLLVLVVDWLLIIWAV